MTETIITAFVTLTVCLINNYFQNKTNERKHEENAKINERKHIENMALIEYKIDELTKQVNKHNEVIERTYRLEKHESVVDEKLKVIDHRLEDLENDCSGR